MQKLQKRLILLENDIASHQEQIDALSAQAQGFVEAGHFDSEEIHKRQETLVAQYEGLQVRGLASEVWLCFTPNLLSFLPYTGATECAEDATSSLPPTPAVLP